MTTKEIPSHVGRFKVNKSLTKAFNYNNNGLWLIYRDPEIGLYAYNEELDVEVNLGYWNVSLDGYKAKNTIRIDWISQIDEAVEEELSLRERLKNLNRTLVIYED